jgi:hypothetical protein
MLKEEAVILTIQGRVKQAAIKQLTPKPVLNERQGWFFIDYAMKEIPLNTKFDVLLEGESKKLISGPGSFSIKLLTCLDQFGNKLTAVPEGYKTICKLEFAPHIPASVKKLPLLEAWDYNPMAISVAKHEDIELALPDDVLKDLYVIVFSHIKNKFSKEQIHTFSKNEFVRQLKIASQGNVDNAGKILENLMQLGKVTRNDNNLLELVETEG